MRPLKLTLTAFGPYKDREIIDFRKLEHNQLFVIAGQTGAGKTTIFDGISFALYGSASGEDRDDISLLRSHFADDDVHTAVELLFEIRGRTYRILRQLGHVKKGNKTKTGDKYEFYEVIDDREEPMVDRQIVSEINPKVEQLIGLTQDQFKQIVMLPQGEFRKLLTSETENKEEILRRLFQTDSYQQINVYLKERRDQLRNEFDDHVRRQDHYIQMIHGTIDEREDSQLFQLLHSGNYNTNQVVDCLHIEIDYLKKQIIEYEQIVKTAFKKYEQKNTIYFEAKAVNEQFDDLHNKEKALKRLNEREEDIKVKEKRLTYAERASEIEPIEHLFNEAVHNEKNRLKQFSKAKEEELKAIDVLKKAQTIFEREQKNEDKREKLRKRIDELNQYVPIVKDLTKNRSDLQKQKELVKQKKKEIELNNLNIKAKTKQLEQLNETIVSYRNATRSHVEKVEKRNEKRTMYSDLNDYLKAKERNEQLQNEKTVIDKQYEKIKQQYKEAEQKWFNDQAVMLASHLQEDEPCPVCGGRDHPNKATYHIDGISKEELEQLKKSFEKAEETYRQFAVKLQSSENELSRFATNIKKYDIEIEEIPNTLNELMTKGKKLTEEINQIEKMQRALEKYDEQKEKLEKQLKQLQLKRDHLQEEIQTVREQFMKNDTILQQQLKQVPEKLQQISVLEKTIDDMKEKREILEMAWKKAETNLQNAQVEKAEKSSQLKSAQHELIQSKEQLEKAKKSFNEAIKVKQFLSIEQYKEAKLDESIKLQLKDDIEQYKSALQLLNNEVKNLKERLQEKERIDLTQLKQEVDELKQTYEQSFNMLNVMKTKLTDAKNIHHHIVNEYEKVKKYEKQLVVVTDLYDIVRGHNDKRISFERYLQIGYLEQIIDAANVRLKELSNGQFLLVRSERQEAHGRQSGLALDIYDAYTGQVRDVKSLSGGEKFNTSLCLALGMSDVIQSFQGGISIDTMFIDEGFGSLDEESLNKAIDTLIDLQQSGRMIGVISHVEQLKAIFPAVLEVNKLKEGYSETKFIIK